MRTCGDCTQCCKVMAVTELDKPSNTWCQHCQIGTGCSVYEERPESCKVFECFWLQEEILPEELRPDRSKVVLCANADGTSLLAHVDPKQSQAWKSGTIAPVLRQLSQKTLVIVVCGSQRTLLTIDPNMKLPHGFELQEQQADGSFQVFKPRQ